MPRATRGFEVNDITLYRPAPELADGDTESGLAVSKFNAASAVSGLLDFGPAGPTVARLHAVVNYRNAPALSWRYSQDGAAWTAITSSVLAGSATDAALPAHGCEYVGETSATTLSGGGIQARYWQVSIQDSDVRDGANWQCGGFAHSSSSAGLMEVWAENAGGTRLIELNKLPIAMGTVTLGAVITVTSDAVKATAAGEK